MSQEATLSSRICRHYRTKAMFSKESGPNRLLINEQTLRFPFGWCAKSSTEIGPDDTLASVESCACTERKCHLR